MSFELVAHIQIILNECTTNVIWFGLIQLNFFFHLLCVCVRRIGRNDFQDRLT